MDARVSRGVTDTVRIWDLESGVCLNVLEGHTNYVWGVALMLDGHKGISGSEDNTVRIWDLESGVCIKVLKGHTDAVRGVALTPDGRKGISREF